MGGNQLDYNRYFEYKFKFRFENVYFPILTKIFESNWSLIYISYKHIHSLHNHENKNFETFNGSAWKLQTSGMAVHFLPFIKWKPQRELRSQRVVGRCPCPGELGLRPSHTVENPPEKYTSFISCHWPPEVSSCHQAWSRVDHLIVVTVPLGQRGGHPVQEVLCEGCCLEPTCPDNWHWGYTWPKWVRFLQKTTV